MRTTGALGKVSPEVPVEPGRQADADASKKRHANPTGASLLTAENTKDDRTASLPLGGGGLGQGEARWGRVRLALTFHPASSIYDPPPSWPPPFPNRRPPRGIGANLDVNSHCLRTTTNDETVIPSAARDLGGGAQSPCPQIPRCARDDKGAGIPPKLARMPPREEGRAARLP